MNAILSVLLQFSADVRSAFDGAADAVVVVAVIGRTAGLDDADELGHVGAARVLVDEVAEGPLGVRPQLGLLREPDNDPATRAGTVLLGGKHRDHDQWIGASVVDL